MLVTELDSFVQKFYHLWHSGLDAHLNLHTHAGNAWVSLHLQLGRAPGPLHYHQPVPKRVGGARLRRKEKRAAARAEHEKFDIKVKNPKKKHLKKMHLEKKLRKEHKMRRKPILLKI